MTEFEKQDQEVMDLVNGTRRADSSVTVDVETERILRRGAPQNDTENGRGDTSSVTCGDTYQQGYACPRQASESGIRCAEHHSSRRRLEQKKCEAARRQLWMILKIFICALVAVLFVAALLDPDMVPAVVNMGVLSCGCVAAVSIDRHFRRRD